MSNVLTDEQKTNLVIKPETAAGNPARIDGVPVWTASDPSVLDLQVDPNGLSAEAVTTGKLGPCQVTVDADADLGAGVRSIQGIVEFEVVAAEAVTLGVVVGPPELK